MSREINENRRAMELDACKLRQTQIRKTIEMLDSERASLVKELEHETKIEEDLKKDDGGEESNDTKLSGMFARET